MGRSVGAACVATALTIVVFGLPARSAAERRPALVPHEVASLRTADSATFVQPDGSFKTSISATPIHFLDGDRRWRRIDSGLVASSKHGVAWTNKANRFRASFPDDIAEGLQLETGDGVSLALTPVDVKVHRLPEKVARSEVSYRLERGVELTYAVLSNGVKENVVLEDASAPSTYRFSLTLEGVRAKDLKARYAPDGSIAFLRDGSGEPVFVLAAPTVSDSSVPPDSQSAPPLGTGIAPSYAKPAPLQPPTNDVGGGRSSPEAVSMSAERVGDDSFAISLKIDPRWLRDKRRVFPVVLDPTISTQPDVQDGYYDTSAGTNLPNVSTAEMTVGPTAPTYAGVVKFDLASLPPEAKLTSAKVAFNFSSCVGSCGWQWPGTHTDLSLSRLTSGWTSTTPWSGIAKEGAAAAMSFDVWWAAQQPGAATWETFQSATLTARLQSMLTGALPNYGFLLEASGQAQNYATARYPDVTRAPRLDVEWVADGVQLAAPTHIHSNGAELYWQHYNGGLGPAAGAVLADNPQAFWRLDDAPDSPFGIADWSGNANHLGASGGFSYQEPGGTKDQDQSLYFDGSSGYLNGGIGNITDTFSLEAWVKRADTTAGAYTIASRGNDPNGGGGFWIYISSSGTIALDRGYGGPGIVQSTTAISDLLWHHVAVTKSGASVHVYIDGVDRTGTVSNQTLSQGITGVDIGANPYYTGSAWSTNYYFHGWLDDVAIWGSALSASQVSAHYGAGAQQIAGFDRYEIHRSTSSGFIPDATTRIATIRDAAIQTYRDTTAKPGSNYSYKVVTYTNGGANSYASDEVSTTMPAAGAGQVTIQPGVAGAVAQATSLSSGSACANAGAAQTIAVDAADRGLLQFDLRQIPSGATVSSASLQLFTFSTPASTIDVKPLTAAWTEGTGTGACNGSGATWTSRDTVKAWASAGGDTSPNTASTSDPGGNPRWDSWDVTSIVQGWINGTSANQGFLLKQQTETGAPTVAFTSDEYQTSLGLRPRLIINYSDGSSSAGPSVGVSIQGTEQTTGTTPTVAGTVTLTAGASDDGRVASVQFYRDSGTAIGVADSSAPYSASFDSSALSGAHTIYAIATDDAGNQTTSATLPITIVDTNPPATSITGVSGSGTIGTASVPAGAIVPYIGAAIPSGWLLADGSAVSRTTQADLFSAIGTSFGAGDGSMTFNLPDLRGRIPLGKSTVGTGSTLGASGGSLSMGGPQISLPTISALSFATPLVGYSVGAVSAFTPTGFSFPSDWHYNYWTQDSALASVSVGAGGGLSAGWTSFNRPAATATTGSLTPTATVSTATAPYRVVRYIVKATATADNPVCALWPTASSGRPFDALNADGSSSSSALSGCLATQFAGATADMRGAFPIGQAASGSASNLNASGGSRDFTQTVSRTVPSTTATVPTYSTGITVSGGTYPTSYSWHAFGGGNGTSVWPMRCPGGSGNGTCMPSVATTPAVTTAQAAGGGGSFSTAVVNDQATTGAYNPAFTAVNYYSGATTPDAGTIIPAGNSVAPTGWLLADGSCVSQSQYPALYTAIGATYGSCSAGLFKLPDLRGRFLLGKATSGTGSTLGASGGSLDITPAASLPNFTTSGSWTPGSYSFSVPARAATLNLGANYDHQYPDPSYVSVTWNGSGSYTSNAFGATTVAATASPSTYSLTSSATGATTATFAAENPPYLTTNYLINAGETVTGYTGTITVTASASDSSGISRVDFLVDGTVLASDSSAPYSASLDTLAAGIYDGAHTIVAAAYANDGSITRSAAQAFTVANTNGTPYQAQFSAPNIPSEAIYDPANPTSNDLSATVTLTNTSTTSWPTATTKLRYRWLTANGSIAATSSDISLGATDVAAGSQRAVSVTITPPTPAVSVYRGRYQLKLDLYDTAASKYFATAGNPPLTKTVTLNQIEGDRLGLERYQQYDSSQLGSGATAAVNLANGNLSVTTSPLANPGRGLNTLVGLTYNSLEAGSSSPVGNNWLLSISGLIPSNTRLDIHPNASDTAAGRTAKWIGFIDADGSYQRFNGRAVGTDTYYDPPAGTHLYLRATGSSGNLYWAASKPDRTTFYFDQAGYPTSVKDADGNTLTFTESAIASGDDAYGATEHITAVTDAAGRSFTVSYLTAAAANYAALAGKVSRITDHGGHGISLDYYNDGNLRRISEDGGTNADGSFLPARTTTFTYTNQAGTGAAISTATARLNPDPATVEATALFSVIDARGNETTFSYASPSGATPWRLASITPRAGSASTTSYSYNTAAATTTVARPLSRTWTYTFDGLSRLTTIVDPVSGATHPTTFSWTADNQPLRVTEPSGQHLDYTYNANGYLTDKKDELGNETSLSYENLAADSHDDSTHWETGRSIPHLSRITKVVQPQGNATAANTTDYTTTFDYTSTTVDRVAHVTDALGNQTTNTYNSDGTLASTTQPNNNDGITRTTTVNSYDDNGLATQVTDPAGNADRASYDARGSLLWTQDANHSSYSGGDPTQYRTQYYYDSYGRVGRTSTPKSTAFTPGVLIWTDTTYDASDNTVSAMTPHYGNGDAANAATTTTTYDAMDRPTLVTGSRAAADGGPVKTQTAYDSAGRITTITKPNGVNTTGVTNDYATTTSYDQLDRTASTRSYAITAAGALDPTKDRLVNYCYDLAGDLRSTTAPAGAAGFTSAGGCPAATTTPATYTYVAAPNTIRFEYDAAHRQTKRLTAATGLTWQSVQTTYDANGNVTSTTDQNGATTTINYDDRGSKIKETDPYNGTRSTTTLWEYNPIGSVSRYISPRGYDQAGGSGSYTSYVTTYNYDPLGRRLTTTLPKAPGQATTYYQYTSYDANGNTTLVSLPTAATSSGALTANEQTTSTYWDTGQIYSSNDPATPTVRFDYTAEGWQAMRVPETAPASGVLDLSKVMYWSYLGDGLTKSTSDLGGERAFYSYDADGNQTSVTEASGLTDAAQTALSISRSFSGFDELTKTRTPGTGGNYNASLYTYNLDGMPASLVDNQVENSSGTVVTAGRTFTYTYDQLDRPDTQTDDFKTAGSANDDEHVDYSYTPTGLLSTQTLSKSNGSGSWTQEQQSARGYFDNGLLKTLTNYGTSNTTILATHALSYLDGSSNYLNGNKASDSFTLLGPDALAPCRTTSCTASWTYDGQDRLTQENTGTGTTTNYTLDAIGNVTAETTNGTTTTKTYAGQQLTTVQTGSSTSRYIYDSSGNVDCVVTSAWSPAACPTAGDTRLLADDIYDYKNRLTAYRAYDGGGNLTISTDYTNDPLDRPTSERTTSGGSTTTTAFSYLGDTNAVSTESLTGTASETKSYSYDASGMPMTIADTLSGTMTRYSYAYDPHKSVSLLLDQAGAVYNAYGYTAYGSSDAAITKPAQQTLNSYRYTGKRWDSGSSSYDMGARRYAPNSGRWLQQDTFAGAFANLGLASSSLTANRYLFTGANPIGFIESDGHWAYEPDETCDPSRSGCLAPTAMGNPSAPEEPEPEPSPSGPAGDGSGATSGFVPSAPPITVHDQSAPTANCFLIVCTIMQWSWSVTTGPAYPTVGVSISGRGGISVLGDGWAVSDEGISFWGTANSEEIHQSYGISARSWHQGIGGIGEWSPTGAMSVDLPGGFYDTTVDIDWTHALTAPFGSPKVTVTTARSVLLSSGARVSYSVALAMWAEFRVSVDEDAIQKASPYIAAVAATMFSAYYLPAAIRRA